MSKRCAAAFAVVLMSFAAATPAVAGSPSSRCASLHGRDLAPGSAARIVEVPLHRGRTRLFGCAPPNGPVRALSPPLGNEKISNDQTRDAFADVQAVRGSTAAVFVYDELGTGDGYEDQRTSGRVWNLRTGHSYLIFTFVHHPDEDEADYDLGDTKRILLDGLGRAAVAYVRTGSDGRATITIAAFTATGRRVVLDRESRTVSRVALPVASLRLSGETATWTVDGTGRSADLTHPAPVAEPAVPSDDRPSPG